MANNFVNLILDLYDGSGNPITQGAVTFTPTYLLTDTTDHLLIPRAPVRVQLLNNPSPTVRLLATDNSAPGPSGWAWQISGTYPGAPPAAQYLIAYSNGSTQHLSDLMPTVTAPVVYAPVSVSGTPTAGQVITAVSGIVADWQTPASSGITAPAGDIGGTTGAPTVVATHLSSALPATQGGSGRASATAYALIAGGTTSTGAAQSVGTGTSGQLLTSNGSSALPTFQAAPSGFANPMTTAGDLLFENSTPAAARLAVGSTGQVLTVAGGLPSWQTPSGGPVILTPSGDTSGITDSAAVASSYSSNGHTILAPGAWYIGAPSFSAGDRWLQGSGPSTVINVVASSAGFTISNPAQMYISDMAFAIGSGSYALTVNGASDCHFWNLYASGSTAAGAILINGDDATEQHWSNVVLRGVGGTAFSYVRTTATDTGGLYLDRVRIVGPPSTAAGGFSFTATGAAIGVAADVFMWACISDNYYNDACLISGLSKFFVTNSWFAMNAAANSGQAALHITGGYNQVFNGCYAVNLLPSSKVVLIDGGAHEIQIGGGSVFDGGSGCTALGLAGAGSGGFSLGAHQNYCATLTDTPAALSVNSGATAPPTFQTAGGGGSGGTIGIDDTANPGTQKWLRVSNGTMQILNTAFSSAIMQLTDAGALSLTGSLDIPTAGQGLKVAEGSNAKQGTATLNGTTAVVVANTSVTANSRIFLTIQSPGGVTPGTPYVSTRTAATSFSLKSTVASDNSVVAYELFEPG